MRERISVGPAIRFGLLAALIFLPGAFWGLPSGTAILGADRVLEGGAPYKDFWGMYAPGHFWLVAALQWAFGNAILVQALAAVLLKGAGAGAFVAVLDRLGAERRVRTVLGLVHVVALWRTAPEVNTYTPALLCMLLAVDRVLAYLVCGGPHRVLIAGTLLGLGAVFKHDVCAYVFLASSGAIAASWWLARDRRPTSWRAPLGVLMRFALGAAIPLAPTIAVLAWRSGADAWEDLIAFPATTFRVVRAEPYPPLVLDLGRFRDWAAHPTHLGHARDAVFGLAEWMLAHLPEPVFLVGAAFWLARRRRLAPADAGAVLLFLVAMPFFWTAAHVQQNTHLYSMAWMSLFLGTIAWRGVDPDRRLARAVLVGGLLVYAFALAIVPAANAWLVLRRDGVGVPLDVPRARGLRVSRQTRDVYQPILDFLRRNVGENERYYNGVARHDAIVATNKHLLMLSERRSCTRFYDLHMGVIDRESVQREIIADIEAHDVRCAVLWHFGWPDALLDAHRDRYRAATPDGGSDLLDRYLAEHFRTVARYGEYEIRWRRDLPAPR